MLNITLWTDLYLIYLYLFKFIRRKYKLYFTFEEWILFNDMIYISIKILENTTNTCGTGICPKDSVLSSANFNGSLC